MVGDRRFGSIEGSRQADWLASFAISRLRMEREVGLEEGIRRGKCGKRRERESSRGGRRRQARIVQGGEGRRRERVNTQ